MLRSANAKICAAVLLSAGVGWSQDSATRIASYRIDATLDTTKHQVNGSETLTWFNDSPDAISELQFHLYMNAFKNEASTFIRESGGQLRGDKLEKGSWGWIDISKLQVAGGPDLTSAIQFIHPDDENDHDQTVVRVPLLSPVAPGATVRVNIDFRTQFPKVYARAGYRGDFLLAGQWFPKIGVYEKAGERYATKGQWNCHQYHANSEFYADYGTYDVSLNVPANEVIGATGVMTSQSRKGDRTTYQFHQENVHDFAWTVQPNFVKVERTFSADREVTAAEASSTAKRFGLSLQDARLSDVKMILLMQPEHTDQIERHFEAVRNAIRYFGLWYGRYPHPTITVVDPPRGAGGASGMEYPTFITAGTSYFAVKGEADPEVVIVHEFGHQFWQGLVGSNEFEEAWMDEGFNTYSTGKLIDQVYGPGKLPLRIRNLPLAWFTAMPEYTQNEFDRAAYIGAGPKADNLSRNSWQYVNNTSYGINSYVRTGTMMRTLENLLGEDTMARVMRTYQARWRYKHPAATDFMQTVKEVSGKDMKWFFDQTIFGSNVLDYSVGEVTSQKVDPFAGVFGDAAHRKTVTEEEAAKAGEKKKPEQYRNRVTIRREGEIVVPVEVKITFEDGKSIYKYWDGAYRWTRFEMVGTKKIKSVEIDPQRKLMLDVNFANNSYVEEPQLRTTLKWTSTMLFWAQQAMQLLSVLA